MQLSMVFLALLLQESKQELTWKLCEGERFAASWNLEGRRTVSSKEGSLPKTDLRTTFSGVLRVVRIAEGKAECEILFDRFLHAGEAGGNQQDILIENGEVKRAAGFRDGGKMFQSAMTTPLSIAIAPKGTMELRSKSHLLGIFLGGQGAFLGPALTARPVARGDSWESQVSTGLKGGKGLSVKYVLAEWQKDECARITCDDVQSTDDGKIRSRVHTTVEAVFNVQAGRCLRSRMVMKIEGKGDEENQEVHEAESVLEFALDLLKEDSSSSKCWCGQPAKWYNDDCQHHLCAVHEKHYNDKGFCSGCIATCSCGSMALEKCRSGHRTCESCLGPDKKCKQCK